MGTTKDKGKVREALKKINGRQTHKKRKRKRSIRFLLIIFALIYLPALWKWIFHGNIETDIIHSGTLEVKIQSEGVFIRNEIAIESPQEGIVIPNVDQGERVPNKHNFAVIIDKNSERALREIENLEKNILRQFAEENPESLGGDVDFNNKVQDEVNKLTDIAENKTVSSIEDIKSTLERLLYQRNRKIFSSAGNRLYLENEKKELEQLRKNIENSATAIEAEFSGIVVWDNNPIDEKYNYNNMDSLAIEDLTLQDSKQVENRTTIYEESFTVNKNQMFARLVNNETSWYVCAIDSDNCNKLKVGDTLSLKIEGIKELIPCRVESMQHFGDKSKVIVSFNRFIEKTVRLKHARVDIIVESMEGLKVPQRSLTNRNSYDNTADIYLVRFNRAVIKRVKIIAEQDTFVIIDKLPESQETDPVRIFDIYVVNPQNIEEGQVID